MNEKKTTETLKVLFIIIGAVVSLGALAAVAYTIFKKYFRVTFECCDDCDCCCDECFDDECDLEPICCCEEAEGCCCCEEADEVVVSEEADAE